MHKLDLKNITDTGIAFSSENDFHKLLDLIVNEAKKVTTSDAGLLYLAQHDKLVLKVVHNDTIPILCSGFEKAGLASVALNHSLPVEFNVNLSAYVAFTGKPLRISDIYVNSNCHSLDLKQYDAATGYHTQSVMVLPLEDYKGQLIGVLQLLNAKDDNGSIVPFDRRREEIALSLASQAAAALTNMAYAHEITGLFHSFVKVMSTAIDERTPYNANHAKNMVRYAQKLLHYTNNQYTLGLCPFYFDENRREQFIMGVWLHDVGKMVTPLKVMDKQSRLGRETDFVLQRFEIIKARLYIDYLEGVMDSHTYALQKNEIEETVILIETANTASFISEEMMSKIMLLRSKTYQDSHGMIHPWLTADEIESLCIRKGTLTEKERKIMEDHVVVTGKLLDKMKFHKQFENVPKFAALHHEFLDGSGYPNHLMADQLSLEARLLTILDIFEALIAEDRPYKKPMPSQHALAILHSMVKEGKLDGDLVKFLEESRAWEEDTVSH